MALAASAFSGGLQALRVPRCGPDTTDAISLYAGLLSTGDWTACSLSSAMRRSLQPSPRGRLVSRASPKVHCATFFSSCLLFHARTPALYIGFRLISNVEAAGKGNWVGSPIQLVPIDSLHEAAVGKKAREGQQDALIVAQTSVDVAVFSIPGYLPDVRATSPATQYPTRLLSTSLSCWAPVPSYHTGEKKRHMHAWRRGRGSWSVELDVCAYTGMVGCMALADSLVRDRPLEESIRAQFKAPARP